MKRRMGPKLVINGDKSPKKVKVSKLPVSILDESKVAQTATLVNVQIPLKKTHPKHKRSTFDSNPIFAISETEIRLEDTI